MIQFLIALAATAPQRARAALDESEIVAALRRRDAAAYTALVGTLHAPMLRLALLHVSSHAVAEEVVQDAWLALIDAIDGFEERSSLKTFVFRIVLNKARTRGARDKWVSAQAEIDAMVDLRAFADGTFDARGMWTSPPAAWGDPERLLADRQLVAFVQQQIARLPPNQARVVELRDVDGLDAVEVCALLELSEENQRVLLHRGRTRLRQAIAAYLTESKP
ncbi:MAG: sigma-70 family RNA polymerase sigma factor [Deltaproteobacteria bacterium]|nr:sigma-70 family RNA polymerase sigma factor [Deltaproteobacteria bacterium]